MSKTSAALRRMGVGVLSTAVIGTGFTAFATTASAATADITGITITPSASTVSTGENVCQLYDISAAEPAGKTGGTVTVQLQPTGGIDSEFCSPATANPGVGNGTLDQEDVVLSAANPATGTIGVKEVNAPAVQGQIQIKVFPSNGTATPSTGAPTATALQNELTASAQNDVVTNLKVDPTSQAGTEGNTVDYDVTATNGASSAVQDAVIYYTVKSSQGNSVGQDNVRCGGAGGLTDNTGLVTCTVTVPTTTAVQSGPYTITFKAPQNASGQTATPSSAIPATNSGPTVTATLNPATPAPANATIDITCGDNTTNKTTAEDCVLPTTATKLTWKATVTTPAATAGGTPNPVSNVEVFWFTNNASATDTADMVPETCVTAADGTCTSDQTFTGTPAQSDSFTVTGELSTCCGAGTFDQGTTTFNNTFNGAPNKVTVKAASSAPKTGTDDVITATVSNEFGSASGQNQAVTFTVTGTGHFANGATQTTVNTGPNGTAQVALESGTAGTSHVTANIDPATTDCETASGGACSASTDVTWSSSTTTQHRVVVNLHLSCFSPKRHVVKCVGQLSRPIAGVTVVFRNSHGTVVGRDLTNSSGKAVMKLRGLKSHRTHRYHAHAKKSAKTFGADSNVAKVRVS